MHDLIAGFRPIGAADSGNCDRCGTLCPKERVLMAAVDGDGNTDGSMTESWGKCCAAQYRYGDRSAASLRRVDAEVAAHRQEQEWKRTVLRRRIATGVEVAIRGIGTTTYVRMDCVRAAANKLFAVSGGRRVGSFLMANASGHEVRTEEADREFYASMGFHQVTAAAE
jgi:hypothetical protein